MYSVAKTVSDMPVHVKNHPQKGQGQRHPRQFCSEARKVCAVSEGPSHNRMLDWVLSRFGDTYHQTATKMSISRLDCEKRAWKAAETLTRRVRPNALMSATYPWRDLTRCQGLTS
jgi:hypothetical protein